MDANLLIIKTIKCYLVSEMNYVFLLCQLYDYRNVKPALRNLVKF